MSLSTEHAVYPTILMLCQSHIINVSCRHHIIRHGDGFLPEAEVVDTIRALCHCKVALTVSTLHTHHQTVLALPFDSACVQRGITHNTLHQVRVVVLIKVVLPLQGHVLRCYHGILVFLVNPVPPLQGFVLLGQQLLVMFSQSRHLLFKFVHIDFKFTAAKLRHLSQTPILFFAQCRHFPTNPRSSGLSGTCPLTGKKRPATHSRNKKNMPDL